MAVWKEASAVTIRFQDGRYVIFDPKGARAESKLTERDAVKTAKRRYPDATVTVEKPQ